MWTVRRCVLACAAALLGGTALVRPADAQDCNWYARKALEQQKQNAERKCGFRGPEWNVDLNAHLGWCRGVAPQEWQKQAQLRDRQLARCPAPPARRPG